MIDPNLLVNNLLALSGTFAALCIPAASVAYFIVANVDDEAEQKHIASIISMSAFAGIVFIITVFLSLGLLLVNACQDYYWIGLIGLHGELTACWHSITLLLLAYIILLER